ncbi:MAG: hypothetical protein CM1200mP10_08130 [Candidatus Neomarinimicrobiota bacterium]|nr:MAG: hypothetical protein CM1200mP10_08130 [Candidatus Neomarinimicrobiota bacterium]
MAHGNCHRNPIWIHTKDAERLGVNNGDLLKITTAIGWFVDKVWVTEAIKPGVVACSHHIGRWRRQNDEGNRFMTNTVNIKNLGEGKWKMETVSGVEPWKTDDPDTNRVWWRDGGVHQNITHATNPDPISGAHCWHQKVRFPSRKRVRNTEIFLWTQISPLNILKNGMNGLKHGKLIPMVYVDHFGWLDP